LIPIHPCGRPVDIGRNAYTTMMRMGPTNEPILVRWFRPPDDTPFIMTPSVYVSRIFDDDWRDAEDDGQVGEVPGSPRTWITPVHPNEDHFGYIFMAGPLDYWEAGPPSPIWLPLDLNALGIPNNCKGEPPDPIPPVETDCVAVPVPGTLRFSYTIVSGSTDLPTPIYLLYDETTEEWRASVSACGVETLIVSTGCVELLGFWFAAVGPNFGFAVVLDGGPPFHAEFGISLAGLGSCDAVLEVSVDAV